MSKMEAMYIKWKTTARAKNRNRGKRAMVCAVLVSPTVGWESPAVNCRVLGPGKGCNSRWVVDRGEVDRLDAGLSVAHGSVVLELPNACMIFNSSPTNAAVREDSSRQRTWEGLGAMRRNGNCRAMQGLVLTGVLENLDSPELLSCGRHAGRPECCLLPPYGAGPAGHAGMNKLPVKSRA